MAHFKIYKSIDGSYSVLFKINNRIEFFGTKQKTKTDCYKAINRIKHLFFLEKAIKIEKTACGSWVFYLIDLSSGNKIGESQTYVSKELLIKQLVVFRSSIPMSQVDSELYLL